MAHFGLKPSLQFAIKITRQVIKGLSKFERSLDNSGQTKSQVAGVIRSTKRYNMATDTNEVYYARQYRKLIDQEMVVDRQKGFRILDLGCGQGRMTKHLVELLGNRPWTIDAVDVSPNCIEFGKDQLADSRITWHQSDIIDFLRHLPDSSVDVVVMLEVNFFLSDPAAVLQEISRVLKFGGQYFTTYRSPYFYMTVVVQQGLFESLKDVCENRQADILRNGVRFNWFTSAEVRQELEARGFSIQRIVGIGGLSGALHEPKSVIIQPSNLSESDRNLLMQAELKLGLDLPETGRYMFVSARKEGTQ